MREKPNVFIICVSTLALPLLALAQFPGGDGGPSGKREKREAEADRSAKIAKDAYEENLRKYEKDPDMLVRPGLLASKKDKRVKIWGRATGLPGNDIAEFFLITADSGKDYESMGISFAKPSDVHAALEFIGMKSGQGCNYGLNRFWPKGERVFMTMQWDEPGKDGGKPTARSVRAEDLVIDSRTNKTLPASGFVFVGSYTFKSEDGKTLYAADVTDSRSIASDFNDPATVLDVPRQAPKSQVYGVLRVNAAYRLAPDQPLLVTLEPEHKDGKLRVRDLTLAISMPSGGTTAQQAKYVLMEPGGKQINSGDTLIHLLAALGNITEAGQDPFVTLQVDDAMPLAGVRQVYELLMKMDNEQGIRIDPPPAGQLYYRAFFPSDEWRDRKKRLGRPWELHLVEKGRQVAATLILPADEIDNNGGKGNLSFTVGSGDEAAKILVEKSNRFSQIVYIFAPRSMHYGELMAFIRPAMKTHPMMYVFF